MTGEALTEKLSMSPPLAAISLPLRNLYLTFLLSLGVLVIVGAAWGTRGYEILVVSMGWPHILLGFLFYFGRVLRDERHERSSFLILALLTLALWGAHHTYTITGFISLYFTYHVFRDEAFIYFQTRARHRLRGAVKVAGLIPFIFMMFLVTDPRPQHYRQDLRHGELTTEQLSTDGWSLVPFDPISYSKGMEFYFYLQTPNKEDAQNFTTLATVDNTHGDGEMRISDRKWPQASDLVFVPFYSESPEAPPVNWPMSDRTIPMSLTGGHRIGQTFAASQNNLAGIWIPTRVANPGGQPDKYQFHLTADTSPSLPPLSPTLNGIRWVLVLLLLLLVFWKALPNFSQNRSFWIYFVLLIATFGVLQKVIKSGTGSGYEFPIMFQLVVIFHYWSWYIFSFDKLRAISFGPTHERATRPAGQIRAYERLIGSLRSLPRFVTLVILLNMISIAGVIWYSKLHGPTGLRFVFDYNYFLYFLVFHVTFSLAPRQTPPEKSSQSI